MIFNTKRLSVRKLDQSDADQFYDLMGNPNVMNPIPQKVFTREESNNKLKELLESNSKNNKKVFTITENENDEFIGFCALIKNNDQNDEIAYRLREKHWGKGYGTEIAQGLIKYCFEILDYDVVTADVNVENKKSINILEKFLKANKEFYNYEDDCTDRRYLLSKAEWFEK